MQVYIAHCRAVWAAIGLEQESVMAKGRDKQKSSDKKKPLKTLLEQRKDKKDKKDGSGRSL